MRMAACIIMSVLVPGTSCNRHWALATGLPSIVDDNSATITTATAQLKWGNYFTAHANKDTARRMQYAQVRTIGDLYHDGCSTMLLVSVNCFHWPQFLL